MSKEVELTGIQMTASVPETIQLSLGLGQNAGVLTTAADAGTITKVSAPVNSVDSLDWSNAVAVGSYYKFGYLIPASSTTGEHIYFTDNANGVGQTIADDSVFTQADTTYMTTYGVGNTTAVAKYADYAQDSATKGYYMDIPVWFRTSSVDNVQLSVQADIGLVDNTTDTVLYKAARVSILSVDSSSGAANANVNAQKILMDDELTAGANEYYNRYGTTVKDQAVYKAGNAFDGTSEAASGSGTDYYGAAQFATQPVYSDSVTTAGTKLVTVPGKNGTAATGDTTLAATGDSNRYGAAVQMIVRVWLEGEDVNCWDSTAGQSFTIDLKFVNESAVGTSAVTAGNNINSGT